MAIPESPAAPAHVVFSIDTMGVGGTEMNAIRTAERLDRDRFRLTVVTLRGDGPLTDRYAQLGIPVVRFPIYSLFGPATVRQAFRLADFLRREAVSIVHCHDQYSNFFSTVSARLAGVPVVIASKRWLHSPLRYRITNGIGFRAATRVLANSDAVASSLRTDDFLRGDRIVVVPNFVDEQAFVPPTAAQLDEWRRDLDLEPGSLVVGIVASLLPIKDHASLLRAVATLAQRWDSLRLVIVGQGPERVALESLARELDIVRFVRFAGLRPQTPSFHYLFDVSVLCSVSEGFPNSLVEAMAAERAIVATDVGGVRDAVRDGETGLLVAPRTPAQLATALDTLLADPSRRRAMGVAGGRVAREHFHGRVVLASLQDLYARLLLPSRPGIA
jgi:glycosyltransferase involved in cell wall biosynthesis